MRAGLTTRRLRYAAAAGVLAVTALLAVLLQAGLQPEAASRDPAGEPPATQSTHEHTGHEDAHGPDPVSAALLVLDGIVGLGVVVLLIVRPRRPRCGSS